MRGICSAFAICSGFSWAGFLPLKLASIDIAGMQESLSPRLLVKVLSIAAALALVACKKVPPPANSISQSEADRITTLTPNEIRHVNFAERYALIGVTMNQTVDGLSLELVWKSLATQRRESLVPLHILDSTGKILAQADFNLGRKHGEVGKGVLWRDTVTIPYLKLVGGVAIGVGLLDSGGAWLLADSGPRDWGNRRLLVPLPPNLPTKESPFRGFLEAANSKIIVGWAWNKDQPEAPVDIEILADELVIAKVSAQEFRQDLQTGGIGTGNHGFRVKTPLELQDGKLHIIRARLAGESIELKKSPRELICKRN
jgi:hypothetical protein